MRDLGYEVHAGHRVLLPAGVLGTTGVRDGRKGALAVPKDV